MPSKSVPQMRREIRALLDELERLEPEHHLLQYRDILDGTASEETVELFNVYFVRSGEIQNGIDMLKSLLTTVEGNLAWLRVRPELREVPKLPGA